MLLLNKLLDGKWRRVGGGAGGHVYRCEISGKYVAVKACDPDSKYQNEELTNEAKVYYYLSFINGINIFLICE